MPNAHALVCPCGSLNFDRTLVMFPLHWTAKCRCCGRPALVCTLQAGPAKREWVNGAFDQYTRWVPGHWKT